MQSSSDNGKDTTDPTVAAATAEVSGGVLVEEPSGDARAWPFEERPAAFADNSGLVERLPSRWPTWVMMLTLLTALAVVSAILMAFIPLPYYALSPGSVRDTAPRIEVPSGQEVFIPDGELGFVTVSLTDEISVWQWIDAKFDNTVELIHEDIINGDQTADEKRQEDRRRMQVSKDAAVIVALDRLGFEPELLGLGIEVAALIPCTVADGILNTGDLIVGIDGQPVEFSDDLVGHLADKVPGDEVELLVDRIDPNNPFQTIGSELILVELGSSADACLDDETRSTEAEARAFLGISMAPMTDFELPFDVDIRTDNVGGPSAGLAFTLAVIDVLSEGELTGDLKVAATGTIDLNGNVGVVGGVPQKTVAVGRAGFDVFLVPAALFDEASAAADDDLIVVPVENLDDALRALGDLGGDTERFIVEEPAPE